MLIYIALFGGAAFGVLIAYLIVVERELKEKSRRLAELGSKSVGAFELTNRQLENEEEAQPTLPGLDTSPELVDLKDENARLLSQIAVLKDERDANQERIRWLETSQDKLPDVERQLADLKQENARLLGQVSELARERDTTRIRVKELEGSKEKFPEMERQLASLKEENTRLSSQIADLRSMILEKIETQLAGLSGLYQQIEASGKHFGLGSGGAPAENRTRT